MTVLLGISLGSNTTMHHRARFAAASAAAVSVVASALTFVPAAYADQITAGELPALLTVAAETTTPAYDRDLFEHWIDADADGCNTRYEVLIEESTTPVTVGAGCSLTGGSWVSPYDGFVASSPAEIEIDHVVALAEAWRSGASGWSDADRRLFANDIDVPFALTAASSVSNQSKSDKDPAEWLPTNTAYACEYVIGWTLTKYRWSLSVDAAELAALQAQLSGDCGATAVELPVVMPTGTGTSPGETVITPFPSGVVRLAGADRYQTSAATSAWYAPGVPVLFVSLGTNFPDALSAASAAALLGGPLLITPGHALPDQTLAEVQRLAPKQIYVTGDANSISEAVVQSLATVAPTARLGGADRFDTGRIIVGTAFTSASHAILASGRKFPDALAATGAAGSRQAPVILVEGGLNSVPAETLALLGRLGVTSLSIVGDANSVSDGIQSQLANMGYSVSRYGGAGRYDTAAMINDAYFPGTSATAFLAAGTKFPDALSAAALAGRLGAPLYITPQECLPVSIQESMNRVAPTTRVMMGDQNSVGAAPAANLACMTVGQPSIGGTLKVNGTLTAIPGVWTPGTSFSYQWYSSSGPIPGATGSSLSVTSALAGKSIAVHVWGTRTGFVGGEAASGWTGAVSYPDRTSPIDTWTCPSWAPIKGNADSGIYHVPGGQYYDATNPEECFTTETAAQAAGYRRSQR
ncbi:cell wall-binding repeat-containing protein [Microbacterium sp. NPDC056569]|uniref:cell wall-binding repeat-containing protein n=1 Tax=Microbacterium sp. NPDC056569 TaxID=3345867 RepID=UPI003670ECF4